MKPDKPRANKYAGTGKRIGAKAPAGRGGRKAKPREIPTGATRVGEIKVNGKYATTYAALLDDRTADTDLRKAIRRYRNVRDLLEDIKRVKTALENRVNWLGTNVIPTLMEDQDILTITVANVGRINLKDDIYVAVPEETREAMMKWFDDNEPDLIKNTINGSQLAAWCRRRLKEGQEVPDMIKITPYTLAVLTKGG